MANSNFRQGDRVSTPHGPGTVAYVRMAPPSYSEIDAVSVVLDGKRDRPGYTGTILDSAQVKAITCTTPPAILTRAEVRAWIRSLHLTYRPQLPRTADRVVYVADAQAPHQWRIRLHESGGYLIDPYVPEVQS